MVTLAVTTYNRPELTIKAFEKVLNDDRISEIVISDDHSSDDNIDSLIKLCDLNNQKMVFNTNEKNLGMMANKKRAIELSSNEWVIIFDSDNVIDSSYLDAIPKEIDPDVIYCPSFARPTFNYKRFSGWLVGIPEAKKMVQDNMGNACLNTCNYLVHRETYLSVWKQHDVKGTDTIAFNYEWLKAGKKFYIVPNMEYDHLVHDGSGFIQDAAYNMKKAEEYKQKILAL